MSSDTWKIAKFTVAGGIVGALITGGAQVLAARMTVEGSGAGKAGQPSFASPTAGVFASPGPSDVIYKLHYLNSGAAQQNGVTFTVTLPSGVIYEPGSTYFSGSFTQNRWRSTSDDGIIGAGLNLGSYAPGGGAYVRFTARPNGVVRGCDADGVKASVAAENVAGKKSRSTLDIETQC